LASLTIPGPANTAVIFAHCCNLFRFVRAEKNFTCTVLALGRVPSRVGTESAATIDLAELLRDLVMPASILGTFGLEIAHDYTGHLRSIILD